MKSPWCIPIVALFRARTLSTTYIYPSFSPIISLFYIPPVVSPFAHSRAVFPSFFLLSRVEIRKRREKKQSQRGEKRSAGADAARASREREEGRTRATMPAEVHSRAITDAVAEGPLTNGFVNHERFKVITHRKKKGGGEEERGELMAVVEPQCRRSREEEAGWEDRLATRRRSTGLIYGGGILRSGQDESTRGSDRGLLRRRIKCAASS